MRRHDLPTSPPPFDPVAFARESDSMVAAAAVIDNEAPTAPGAPSLHALVAQESEEATLVAQRRALPLPLPLKEEPPRLKSDVRRVATSVSAGRASVDRVPHIIISAEDLAWFDLTPRARTLVEQIDGVSTLVSIIAVSGLTVSVAFEALDELVQQGVVAYR